MRFEFKAPVWVYAGQAAWRFVTLPKDLSRRIKFLAAGPRRGFGSVRVQARLGATCWRTSLFPDSRAGAYLLPLKAEVRKNEGIADGDRVRLILELDI